MRADTPEGFVPPYEAFEAKYAAEAEPLVSVFLGVWDRGEDAAAAWSALREALAAPDGPAVVELSCREDVPGADTRLAMAYWRDADAFARWSGVAEAWLVGGADRLVGRWMERAEVRRRALDTLIAVADVNRGLAKLADRVEVTPCHGHRGGTRDRILIAEDDPLENPEGPGVPEPHAAPDGFGQVVDAVLPGNVVTRGGPDWSACAPDEMAGFRNSVSPAYVAGGRHLRDARGDSGCCAAHLVRETDAEGRDVARNHQIAFFVRLSDLEAWTKHHPIHEAVFGRFMRMVQRPGRMPDVNLHHEVTVMPAGGFRATYVNCLPETGVLRLGAARGPREAAA